MAQLDAVMCLDVFAFEEQEGFKGLVLQKSSCGSRAGSSDVRQMNPKSRKKGVKNTCLFCSLQTLDRIVWSLYGQKVCRTHVACRGEDPVYKVLS